MLAIPNAISFVLLMIAVYFARQKNIRAHKTMVFFTMMSSCVLVYLFADMRLRGGSLIDKDRLASFSLEFKVFLASHIIAATITFLLSLVVCALGLREPGKKWHKKFAYILITIWAYSAISGLVVNSMVGSPDEAVSPLTRQKY